MSKPRERKAYLSKYYSSTKTKQSKQKALKKYGTDGHDLMVEQHGFCPGCSVELFSLPSKHRHIDHDHATGTVRGWLCHWCNMAVGQVRDNPTTLRALATYLEKHR